MAKLVMNINMIRTGGGRGSRYGVDDLALQDRASLWAAIQCTSVVTYTVRWIIILVKL